MKKSIIKNISLGLSCLLGIGGAISTTSVITFSNNKGIAAYAYEGTPLPTSGTLSSGTYYLSSDLTVSSQLKITSGDVIVNLNGCTLNGGGRDKGIFHVTGGTLTVNGKDDETGKRGTLNNGGGYYPGSGYSYGGALYITAGGATLNDLDITNCQANWGGAIHMSNSAVTLNNCNLSGNIDTNGYGFYGAISVGDSSAAGTGLTVNGGEMFSNNGAIYLGNKAKATINGAYIHDNDRLGVCVATNEGGLKISGNTIIKDNNSSPRNLVLNNSDVAKVGIVSELGNDACIGVTISGDTKGVFTNSTDTSLNVASKFFSDDSNYGVIKNDDGQLTLSTYVATITNGSDITYYDSLDSALPNWVDGSTLTLIRDVSTSSTITVNNTRTLDFNGCGIRATNEINVFRVTDGGNLTFNDSNPNRPHKIQLNNYLGIAVDDGCTTTDPVNNGTGIVNITGGYITGGFANGGSAGIHGGAVYVNASTITLNKGTIIGNKCDQDYCAGAGFWIENQSTFYMYGGSIIYNYAGNAGSGIAAYNNSTLEIYDGYIAYNRNNWAGGAALSCDTNCTLRLYGGRYENNISRHADGAIDFKSSGQYFGIKGSPVVQNNTSANAGITVNIKVSYGIHIDGPLTEGAKLSVALSGTGPDGNWVDGKGKLTTGWSTHMGDADPGDYFICDNPNYSVYLNNGEAYVGEVTATVTSGTTSTIYSTIGEAVTAWNNAENGATLKLLKDATIDSSISVSDIKTFDLNGRGINANGSNISIFTVAAGGDLTLNDSGSTTHYYTFANVESNGAAFATICDKATYEAAAANARGTFDGGYLTNARPTNTDAGDAYHGAAIYVAPGGKAIMNGGTVIGNIASNASAISSYGEFTMNDGNVIYNRSRRGAVLAAAGEMTINGGHISYNTGRDTENCGTCGAILIYDGCTSFFVNGGYFINNFARYGGFGSNISTISISGNPVIKDNIGCGSNGTDTTEINVSLFRRSNVNVYFDVVGELTEGAEIGVTIENTSEGVFTNSSDISFNDASKFHSDNSNYIVGKNADGQLLIGTPRTVAYSTEYGTVPVSETVASGSVITKPTDPSQEGYEFKGWYKDSNFENVWDFETDTVTSNTILFGKWQEENPEANRVIQLINDIGTITYDGGKNDSLDDIIAAKAAYDALEPAQQAIVDENNKDVLDHAILVYGHVDNVGDLIKAIPEASDSQEYYNAVEAALAAYDALTNEEKEILNTDISFDYDKVLEDNQKVKEVIEIINDIGDVTYDGGDNDSLEDIKKAEDAYDLLSDEQKALVDKANKDDLDDAKDTYNEVDETVKLIESIGEVTYGGEDDSKDDIDAARKAYDSLSDEQKELVKGYNDTYQDLDNTEKVYEAIELIDEIGDVNFDNESNDKINAAREYYESLSDEQKDMVNNNHSNPLATLTKAEENFANLRHGNDILILILIIIVSIILFLGLVTLFFLIKRRRELGDDGHKLEGKKVYSIGALPVSVILASLYFEGKHIALYILIFLAVTVWIACLVVYLNTNKKKHKVVEDKLSEEVKKAEEKILPVTPVMEETSNENEEEEEVITVTDEKGNIFNIRYVKSFTAKLIQSPGETKKYYEELKNEVLSYKKTTSRISWHFDSINSGRNQVLKFAIRGKTLCVYLSLNADDYEDTKYKVEKTDSKKFSDVPCLYRIKNDRRCEYAKDLIATVMAKLGLEKGEEQHEVYSNLPYEENKPLVARGLIKELKVQVNKPAAQPVILESKVNSDGDEVVLTKDSSGNIFEIRYVKSFTAKLSQSEDVTKDYYTVLKNYVLSYKGTHSRVSWHYDAINIGRDYILKFSIRGKTLCVYCALDMANIEDKYKVEEAKGKKFSDVPVLYRIKNDRRCEYAKELIDLLMKEHGLNQGDIPNEDYHIKKESTKALLAKGLIKEVKSKVQDKEIIKHYESISVNKADEEMSDEQAGSSLEEVEVTRRKKGSKEIINIDTLSMQYNDGEEVTLESLIEKRLVSPKTGHIKILARGELNKKLHVVANDYSLQAIKMIVLMGGTAKKIK